jgi:hypothetical protein
VGLQLRIESGDYAPWKDLELQHSWPHAENTAQSGELMIGETLETISEFSERLGAVLVVAPLLGQLVRQRLLESVSRAAAGNGDHVARSVGSTIAVRIRAQLPCMSAKELAVVACGVGLLGVALITWCVGFALRL